MRCQLLAAITLFLQLQGSSAAPVDEALQNVQRDSPVAKRCMTQSEITNLQTHWPMIGRIGPAFVACSSDASSVATSTDAGTLKLRAADVEALARRYLADERSTPSGGVDRRCMTDAQISAFQAAWPKFAGLGPALVSCPQSD